MTTNTGVVVAKEVPVKTREDYLFMLRKCSKLETLETVIHHKELTLPESELVKFCGAADHRLAEIKMGRLYDKVPASVWKFIY